MSGGSARGSKRTGPASFTVEVPRGTAPQPVGPTPRAPKAPPRPSRAKLPKPPASLLKVRC